MKALSFITLMMIPLALLGGLSLGATVPLWMITLLAILKQDIAVPSIRSIRLELVLLGWSIASAFWSPDLAIAAKYCSQMVLILLAFLVLQETVARSDNQIFEIIKPQVFIGFGIAIFLFWFEYFSGGLLNSSFRVVSKSDGSFWLHMLDRGCSFLSVLSWLIIAIIIQDYKKSKLAFAFYVLMLGILMISDSLAGFVAFVCAGLLFALGAIFGERLLKLASLGLVLGSIMMPVVFYSFPALDLIDRFDFLPLSAKHRILIWNLTSLEAAESPIIGHGFAYIKTFDAINTEVVNYEGVDLKRFSSHPHNNILQMLLETGLIGAILFLAIVVKYLQGITARFKASKYLALCLYAATIDYYVVGMISYNIWQVWWLGAGLVVALLFALYDKRALSSIK